MTKNLKITFTSEMVYQYKNVPKRVYERFRISSSKGIYFNQNIKNRFKFQKLEG
ncbi:KTSC domain-containing protein [Pedobacter mucosus]|nr:KTSC domain-containing protein [Pedobacter mucosus]